VARRKNNNKQNSPVPKINFQSLRLYGFWALIIIVIFGVLIFLGSSVFLNFYREHITDYINKYSEGHLVVAEIKGNIASYLILEDVYYTVKDVVPPEYVFTSDSIALKFSIWDLLSRNVIPKKVILDGFALHIRQDEDGNYILPRITPPPENAQGGQMSMPDMRIIIKNSSLDYTENKRKFKNPLELNVDDINASVFLNKSGKLKIRRCTGKFLESELSARGEIETFSSYESSLKLDVEKIALWQLANTLGRLFPSESKLRPTGDGEIQVRISGPILNPRIEGKGHLDKATIGKFHIEDAHFKLKYMNKNVELTEGIAKCYDGRIIISGEINADANPPKFKLDAKMKDFNLGMYIKQLECGVDPVSGSFDGKFTCSGDFVNLSGFKGEGELSCENGMYLNPFKKASTGLFKKRQEVRMGFKSLDMDLAINELEVFLNRFEMESSSTKIDADGIIDFDGSMNLEGTIIADSQLFKFNERFSELFELLPARNVNIPVRFRLTGKPSEYILESAFPEEIIDKYLGNDETRKRAAQKLLEKYFGEAAGMFSETIPDISPDTN